MGQSLRRDVLELALPAFLSLVAPPLFLLVDAAIVGTLGTTALAALGAGSAVFSTVVGLSFFLAYHTTGSVARAMGAGDQSRALKVAGSTLALGLVLGAALSAIVFVFAAPLLRLMGVGDAVLASAIDWLRAVSFALPGALAGMAAVGLFRGLKDTRTPLVVTIIQVIINAVLCWAFIIGLNFGVAGSGWATSIAESAGLVMYGIALHRHLPGGLRQLMPSALGDLWKSLRDGSALIWRSFMLRGVLSGVVIAAAHLGDKPLAAFHVSYVVWYTLALALDAIAVAAQAIIGGQIGMRDTAAARATLNTMLRWGAALGTVQAAAVAVASPLIAPGFFTRSRSAPAHHSRHHRSVPAPTPGGDCLCPRWRSHRRRRHEVPRHRAHHRLRNIPAARCTRGAPSIAPALVVGRDGLIHRSAGLAAYTAGTR